MMDMRVFETAQRLAKEYRAPAAHIAAVIQVESAGVYSPTQIRWEGHYFYRLLSGAKRDAAVKAGLADPKAGKVKNPRSQDARYAILHRAMEIDAGAAIMSTSFGVGQVMGAHWKVLGYASAEALRLEAMTGLYGQARLMMQYIVKFGLLDELQEGQWAAFARGYNGPGYRTNRYDEKLAKAAAAFGGRTASPDGMLRLGAKGARVRELQALLVRAGEPVKVDGDFGQTTRDAVRALQKRLGLIVDGVVGPETMAAFTTFRTSPDEKLGARRLVDLPHFGKVAGSVLGAGGLAEAKDQLETMAAQVGAAAGHLTMLPSLAGYAEAAASGLVAVAAVVGVAALAYGAWQWVSAGRTYEGVPA